MKNIIKKINSFVADTLFPIHCLNCKAEGNWICESCHSQVKINIDHVCGVCEKMITPDGKTCLACKKTNPLDGLIVVSSYSQPLIAKAVHLFKYRFIPDLHIPLGNLLIKSLKSTESPLPDLIIPIPLHQRRLRWRGFNQSALLASHIAKNLLPNCELRLEPELLIRSRYTPPQMKIKNFTSRRQNMDGAFSLAATACVKNKTVLLVDDITTTGSTIFECAKILKKAGASFVYAVALARQDYKK